MSAQINVIQDDRILNIRKVTDRTSLSRRAIYSLIKEGKFPAQVKISSRRIGWLASAIDLWVAKQGASA